MTVRTETVEAETKQAPLGALLVSDARVEADREARQRATTEPALGRPSTSAARCAATTIPVAPSANQPPRTRSPGASLRERRGGETAAISRDARALLRKVIPRVLRSPGECAAAPLDHHEGFLLAHIDGRTPVEALVDICGLPEEEVLALLHRLRSLRIVTLG